MDSVWTQKQREGLGGGRRGAEGARTGEYYEKRRRLALWPAGGFLWGGQSRVLLFITRNIKLPTLPRGTVRPPWILTTTVHTASAGDGHTILSSISLSSSLARSASHLIASNLPPADRFRELADI